MANILKVLKGPLSTLGKKNRNGRIYSKELWENVLNSEYWNDMIKNNSLCGEVVHPGERTESDPFEIDVRNISHRIKEAHIEGDKLIGTVEVLDTEQGRNLAQLIDAGCTVGISARGMGDLDGDYVDPNTYNFKCFDITMRPSDPNARLVPLTESEHIKLIIKESEETDLLINEEDHVPFTKQNIVQNQLVNELYKALNKLCTNKDLTFKSGPGSIQALYKGDRFGNIFVKKLRNDDNSYQIDKYLLFTNITKSGYKPVPTREAYNQDLIDKYANEFLNDFYNKILLVSERLPEDNSKQLDLFSSTDN